MELVPNKIYGPHGANVRYKGGSPDPPSSTNVDTPSWKKARGQLYPMLTEALDGKGFGAENLSARYADMSKGLSKAFNTARFESNSSLSRILQPGDNSPREYIDNALSRGYATAADNLNRQKRMEQLTDKDLSRDMAAGVIANDLRMSVDTMQSYNQAMQQSAMQQAQYGTFGTNVAGGIGNALPNLYFAQKMSAKK